MAEHANVIEHPQKGKRALARALAPYLDNLPYDRERVIQYGKYQLEQAFISFYEVGKCLLLLYEHEPPKSFALILEEHFGGTSLRVAQFYMRFARFAGQFPRFRAMFERPRMIHKGLALLGGLNDPEAEAMLAEYEISGAWGGLSESDILAKSVKDLKAENRRLRQAKDQAAAAQDAKIKKLEQKVEILEVQAAAPDLAAATKLFEAADEHILEAMGCLRRITLEHLRDATLRAAVLGRVDHLNLLVADLEGLALKALAQEAEAGAARGDD